MYRSPKRKILQKMLHQIGQTKMEFGEETAPGSGLAKQLQNNLQRFRTELHSSTDLIIRQFTIGINKDLEAAVVYIDGLVDKKQIEWSILKSLMTRRQF